MTEDAEPSRAVTTRAHAMLAWRRALQQLYVRETHPPFGEGMNEKELAALVRKTVKKASKPKAPRRKTYDATLDATRQPETDEDAEAKELFKEMKRREF